MGYQNDIQPTKKIVKGCKNIEPTCSQHINGIATFRLDNVNPTLNSQAMTNQFKGNKFCAKMIKSQAIA